MQGTILGKNQSRQPSNIIIPAMAISDAEA